ncbi:transketolase C-terminal domain-containing protein [Stigmatella sp. ncwal1]|uniref:Transketolase C-terminal domain-containing protein n=1 Tax=Stigmatella ashevillensis TaxID=2995309 RepID=A0ABT5DE37_9BACT|nr:transketolase C-terminal domain-containing protein [Stigmatella ashevillena]MDC0711911.1 transketolase C-terminal domain-containing protein [Stigmatella ashevillena]
METMRERFVSTTQSLLGRDPRLAVVLADISADVFAAARRQYPHRVINVGIREQLMISVAAGLALEGLRPVVHSYTPFLIERPYEQLKLGLCHQDVGAVLVSIGASYDWAAGGRTHQAPEDVALLDALPGWTVHVPGHPDEVEPLLRDALPGRDRVYLRLSLQTNAAPRPIVPGRFDVVRRGRRGTIIAVGPMLDGVLSAVAEQDLTVLYAATIRPFDAKTLLATLSEPTLVLVEPYLEGTSAHAVTAALTHLPHRLLSVGVGRAELRRYGTAQEHEAAHGLDVRGLRERITSFLRP